MITIKTSNKKLKFSVLLLMIFIVSPAFARGWEKDDLGEWHYVESDGNYATNKIVNSGLSKFYLNNEGNIEKNYFLQDYRGASYYFGPRGEMVTNFSVYISKKTKSNKSIAKSQYIYFDNMGKAATENGEYLPDSLEHILGERRETANVKNKYLYLKNGDSFIFGNYSVEYPDGFIHNEDLTWVLLNRSIDSVIAYCTNPLYAIGSKNKLHCNDLDIMQWMQQDFFKNAFNEYEKELITTTVSNPDKIFIINNNDYKNFINENEMSYCFIGISLSIK